MGKLDRLVKLRHWLVSGQCVQPMWAMHTLEVSRATLTRDIAVMRDDLGAPIDWDPDRQGWYLARADPAAPRQYELPGLHFTAEEIHALLTMQHLLSSLDAGGLLGPHIAPLMQRVSAILGAGVPPQAEVTRRIHVRTVGARKIELPHFQALGTALLRRQRLVLIYQGRSTDTTPPLQGPREVSPQRLVHYRDNWYLDGWCHRRKALRSFAVDAIQSVQVVDMAALDVPEHDLDDVLGVGYGIFAGRQVQWARLRFSASRSRWVAAERWHPQQRGSFDGQGRWQLDLPYADPRELLMDILRHVPDVEVLWPEELEQAVMQRLRDGLGVMGGLDE